MIPPGSTVAPMLDASPWALYGVMPPIGIVHDSGAPGIERAAGPSRLDDVSMFHPHSPMFWFGVIAAATFGLVAVSSTVRVGPFRAGAALGKP